MWNTVLDRVLSRFVGTGRLRVKYPDGTWRAYGPGPEPDVSAELQDPAIVRALCLAPEMAVGEGYMSGAIKVETEDFYDFVRLLVLNRDQSGLPVWVSSVLALKSRARRWLLRNTPMTAKQNVSHHYDISDEFYQLFLDRDMQYSCAYFSDRSMSLEEAQEAKKAHIAAKLNLSPGMRVLDIGCGWGGMALTLARDFGVHVTGVTLSENQLATAKARAEAAGLTDKTDFRLLDYRKLDERFDRIVSVGMLEHVGTAHYDTYFGKVKDLLTEDGIALIHTIGYSDRPHISSRWLRKYIFPGGHIPTLSELAPSYEKAGLWITDIEVLRGHYGPTCHHWRDRFEAALPKVREMYDEAFIRMWRFYLVACEVSFEEQRQGVFQLQLARKQYAVPVTRNYLYLPESHTYADAAQ